MTNVEMIKIGLKFDIKYFDDDIGYYEITPKTYVSELCKPVSIYESDLDEVLSKIAHMNGLEFEAYIEHLET